MPGRKGLVIIGAQTLLENLRAEVMEQPKETISREGGGKSETRQGEHVLIRGAPMLKKRLVPVSVEALQEAARDSAGSGDNADEVLVSMCVAGRMRICRQMVSSNVIPHWWGPSKR